MREWSQGVCGDGAVFLRDGQPVSIDDVLAHIEKLEAALSGVVKHWREFGGMMVYDNATNRDDYGLDERIEAVAKLIEK